TNHRHPLTRPHTQRHAIHRTDTAKALPDTPQLQRSHRTRSPSLTHRSHPARLRRNDPFQKPPTHHRQSAGRGHARSAPSLTSYVTDGGGRLHCTSVFVNRSRELEALGEWWEAAPGGRMALVWGRRRVGKTALLNAFAQGRRTVFHTGAGRPVRDELRVLGRAAEAVCAENVRDLQRRPLGDWDDVLDSL